jgi:hypothetical protein
LQGEALAFIEDALLNDNATITIKFDDFRMEIE